jgi:glycosyltransferase involved in cell wall biosynthesis
VKSVLHVLPHPGGGGETYVNSLDRMDGYAFERFYLAPSPVPRDAVRTLTRTAFEVQIEARKHDLIHVEGEVAGAICFPSLVLRPSVVTLNGLHLLRRVDGVKKRVAKANLRLMLVAASRVICVSESEYADVIGMAGERAGRRAVLIRNGIELPDPPSAEEREEARALFGLSPDVAVGAWLAGLDEHKDPRTAVLAAIRVARAGVPFVLLVAGDGPLRAELTRTADTSETDAVRLLGFRRDGRRVLAAADFFVLSSRREGLSFSVLEAMSIGLPAVVSDGPGNSDAVGDAGVVVPAGDVRGFAVAFERLTRDVEVRDRLGARARTRVRERFGADEMVRHTRAVYQEALAERRRGRRRVFG